MFRRAISFQKCFVILKSNAEKQISINRCLTKIKLLISYWRLKLWNTWKITWACSKISRVYWTKGSFPFFNTEYHVTQISNEISFFRFLLLSWSLDTGRWWPGSSAHCCFYAKSVSVHPWKSELELTTIETDKKQKYSMLLCWLAPFIRWYTKKKFGTELTQFENCSAALYGRTMVAISRKK